MISFWTNLSEYFLTPLPSASTAWKRARLHLMVMALIGGLAFVVNMLMALTTLPAIIYCAYCAFKTGLLYGFGLYAADEWLARALPGACGRFDSRTVECAWTTGLAGFLLGFGLMETVRVLEWEKLDLLSGIRQHVATPVLAPWEQLLRVIPFALLVIFLVVHIRLKRQVQEEMQRVSHLNQILQGRQGLAGTVGTGATDGNGGGATVLAGASVALPLSSGSHPNLVVSIPGATEVLQPGTITHVSIEEHYSRIFLRENSGYREIEVKLPLKDALAHLPLGLFVQIHRSHIVNMTAVSRIERMGGGYQLILEQGRFALPISRQRAPTVLPRLNDFWREKPERPVS